MTPGVIVVVIRVYKLREYAETVGLSRYSKHALTGLQATAMLLLLVEGGEREGMRPACVQLTGKERAT